MTAASDVELLEAHEPWALMDADGHLLSVEDTMEQALDHASSLGDPVLDLYGEREDALEPGEAQPMAANPRRSLPTVKRSAAASLEQTGLPKVTMAEVLERYPLENEKPYGEGLVAAHADLLRFFPTRKRVRGEWRPVEVWQDPMRMIEPGALLGQNRKLEKPVVGPDGKVERRTSVGLSLLPARMAFAMAGLGDGSLCLWSTPQCRSTCLVFSGLNRADPYNQGVKLAKARALLEEPIAFCRVLLAAIHRFACGEDCLGWHPYVRLNVYSDIPWERFFPELFRSFPDVSFYDYTKVPGRTTPDNYDLTFSYSGTPANIEHCEKELRRPRRVAVVFGVPSGAPMPSEFLGHRVIDGTLHDFRPLDPPNEVDPEPVIVGLRWRPPMGRSVKRALGAKGMRVFVVPCYLDEAGVTFAESPRYTSVPEGDDQ